MGSNESAGGCIRCQSTRLLYLILFLLLNLFRPPELEYTNLSPFLSHFIPEILFIRKHNIFLRVYWSLPAVVHYYDRTLDEQIKHTPFQASQCNRFLCYPWFSICRETLGVLWAFEGLSASSLHVTPKTLQDCRRESRIDRSSGGGGAERVSIVFHT